MQEKIKEEDFEAHFLSDENEMKRKLSTLFDGFMEEFIEEYRQGQSSIYSSLPLFIAGSSALYSSLAAPNFLPGDIDFYCKNIDNDKIRLIDHLIRRALDRKIRKVQSLHDQHQENKKEECENNKEKENEGKKNDQMDTEGKQSEEEEEEESDEDSDDKTERLWKPNKKNIVYLPFVKHLLLFGSFMKIIPLFPLFLPYN